MAITSIDPRDGRIRATFTPLSDAAIDQKLATAQRAFRQWRRTSFEERARALVRVATLLESEKEALARLMTEEMGKTYVAAQAEAEKCARVCRYYAEHGARALADEAVPMDEARAYVRYLPLGPI